MINTRRRKRRTNFKDANAAFKYFYDYISRYGVEFDNTKAIFDVGFTLKKPMKNQIFDPKRDFNPDYAQAEWDWYMSGDRNIKRLGKYYGKIPAIWKRMADEEGNVNSNYGWQWLRHDQIGKVARMIIKNPSTRKAALSIYDGKEIDDYSNDTPCTYAIQFTVLDGKLNMSVYMRSNDLWYGFCIDQFCFSKLQMLMCNMTGYPIGTYYHHVHNLHIYNNKLGK